MSHISLITSVVNCVPSLYFISYVYTNAGFFFGGGGS